MKRARFKIIGQIVTKARPRAVSMGGFARVYTPQTTINYENLVKVSYQEQCGDFSFGDKPLNAHIIAYFLPPEAKRELAEYCLCCTNKKDVDNIAKTILDALNKVAYSDDNQVISLKVEKEYSMEKYEYVEVVIRENLEDEQFVKWKISINKLKKKIKELETKENRTKAQEKRLQELKAEFVLKDKEYQEYVDKWYSTIENIGVFDDE